MNQNPFDAVKLIPYPIVARDALWYAAFHSIGQAYGNCLFVDLSNENGSNYHVLDRRTGKVVCTGDHLDYRRNARAFFSEKWYYEDDTYKLQFGSLRWQLKPKISYTFIIPRKAGEPYFSEHATNADVTGRLFVEKGVRVYTKECIKRHSEYNRRKIYYERYVIPILAWDELKTYGQEPN